MKTALAVAIFLLFLFAPAQAANLDCIDINTAPKEELIKIKHIGEARAKQIINLRIEKLFSSVDDLERVVGIGLKRIADIKEQDLACVNTQELQIEPESGPEPEPEPELKVATTTPVEAHPQDYPSGVVINEILPSPAGPDEEEEWIEIYNQNSVKIDLSGWQTADAVGKTNAYAFPAGTIIGPQGFLVLSRPTTGITLNNSGDGLSLIRPKGEAVYAMSYQKAPRGESFNRTDGGWVWSKTLTPGSGNIVSAPEEKEEPRSKPKTEFPETGSWNAAATVGEQSPKWSGSRLTASVALALAIFSGTIILALKKKLKMS